MKIRYDSKKCTGCCACQMACLDQCDIRPLEGQNALCRIVELEHENQLSYQFVHCINCGACAKVCPTGCLYRDENGWILANENLCIQCHSCSRACPFGIISFDLHTGTVKKCDGCIGRVLDGRLPACVHTCPTGALSID